MTGPWELVIIGLVVVLLFGAKKLPELARSMGKASSEFKKGIREGADEPTGTSEPASHPESPSEKEA